MKIEKLGRQHEVSSFTCGNEALDRFLHRFALPNQLAQASQSYVALDHDVIIGFHTLVVGEVQFDAAPERLRKGLSRHPVPVMILARLAVSAARQGHGLGQWLLKDAIQRTLQAADIAGIRAFIVHARNDEVRRYYLRFGFAEGFTNPLHLYVLTKELKSLLA